MGILFEIGSSKWIELIPGNARFHSSREKATAISRSVYDDPEQRFWLLDAHNLNWYVSTIEFQELS